MSTFTCQQQNGLLTLASPPCRLAFDLAAGGRLVRLENPAQAQAASEASRGGPASDLRLERYLASPGLAGAEIRELAEEVQTGKPQSQIEILSQGELGPATWEFGAGEDSALLTLVAGNDEIELHQTWHLSADRAEPWVELAVRNCTAQDLEVDTIAFVLGGLRMSEQWTDEYVIPTEYNAMYNRCPLAELAGHMLDLSISPTGISMPWVMDYTADQQQGLLLAGWNEKSDFGFRITADAESRTGQLSVRFKLFKSLWAGELVKIGEVHLWPFAGEHYAAMQRFQDWIGEVKGYHVPADRPDYVHDTVIGNVGLQRGRQFNTDRESMDEVGVERLTDLIPRFREYKEFGINTIMIHGFWHSSMHELHDERVMPNVCCILPINDRYEVTPEFGGPEACREMVKAAHEMGLRLLVWITAAGLPWQAEQVQQHPEWFLYDRVPRCNSDIRNPTRPEYEILDRPDEYLAVTYPEIATADPLNYHWRQFMLDSLQYMRELGFDGVFVDSLMSVPPNFRRYPWYGENIRGNVSLWRDLRAEMKKIDPDFFVMGETKGYETARVTDLVLFRNQPHAPRVPEWQSKEFGPEEVLDFLRIERLSLLPGQKAKTCDGYFSDGWIAEEGDPRNLGEERFPWFVYELLGDFIFRTALYCFRYHYMHPARPSQWIQRPEDLSPIEVRFWDLIKHLLEIRAQRPELRRGEQVFEGIECDTSGVVTFARVHEEGFALCLINFNSEPVHTTVTVPDLSALGYESPSAHLIEITATEQAGVQADLPGTVTVELPAYGYLTLGAPS